MKGSLKRLPSFVYCRFLLILPHFTRSKQYYSISAFHRKVENFPKFISKRVKNLCEGNSCRIFEVKYFREVTSLP